MVPDAARIVDALAALREEGAKVLRRDAVAGRCDDDQEGRGLERDESLRAERMLLHHRDGERHGQRPGAEDVDQRMPALRRDIDAGEVVEAGRGPVVDLEVLRAVRLDRIAERSKGGARQWLCCEDRCHRRLRRG